MSVLIGNLEEELMRFSKGERLGEAELYTFITLLIGQSGYETRDLLYLLLHNLDQILIPQDRIPKDYLTTLISNSYKMMNSRTVYTIFPDFGGFWQSIDTSKDDDLSF